MPTTLNDKMKKLNAARRKKEENRSAQLIAQEMSLRDLRKARSVTQDVLVPNASRRMVFLRQNHFSSSMSSKGAVHQMSG